MPSYALSAEDFKKAPQTPKPYVPGEKVTRENFADFLIRSFAVSHGTLPAQYAFFLWTEAHTGLNIDATFDAFYAAGGFKALSSQEQELFVRAFEKVPKHQRGVEDHYKEGTDTYPLFRLRRLQDGVGAVIAGGSGTNRSLQIPPERREKQLARMRELKYSDLSEYLHRLVKEARLRKDSLLELD